MAPRMGWQHTVESQGLVFALTDKPDGTTVPYWNESAYYQLTRGEVDYLEEVTEELHGMCKMVVRFVLEDPARLKDFHLDPTWAPYLRATLDEPSVYGRFDLAYSDLGRGHAKLLEYNADTPTGLVESSVAQWYWLQDVRPTWDQWNSLHERLEAAWRDARQRFRRAPVHFAHSKADTSGEEWMTVAYMRDVAEQAGMETRGLQVEDIGWDATAARFVGLDGEPLDTVFKLYPWEDLITDGFGYHILGAPFATRWVEPAWKMMLSNKALLAYLWEMFPDHANLLPAYLDGPRDMPEYVAKPLHGREGDGIVVVTAEGRQERASEHYGSEGFLYQQYVKLHDFDGNYPVLGTWMVGDSAAGLGIRESDGPITDYYARFVPHAIDADRPEPERIAAWLRK